MESCEVATTQRFVLANGIAVTSDRRTYFVVDSATRHIHVLQRSDTGQLVPVGLTVYPRVSQLGGVVKSKNDQKLMMILMSVTLFSFFACVQMYDGRIMNKSMVSDYKIQ